MSDQLAAWLATIPASDLAAAERATHQALTAWFAGGAIAIAAAWLIHRSGLLAHVTAEGDKRGPWVASLAAAGVFIAILLAILVPVDLFIRHADPVAQLLGAAAGAVAALVVLPLFYGLARAAPRFWWAWGGGGAVVLSLAIVWGPYAAASGPGGLAAVPPGPAREGVRTLLWQTNVRADGPYLSNHAGVWADVSGTPGSPRVTVSPDMLRQASIGEIRASLGHVLSHFRHNDQLTLALVIGALAALGFVAARLAYRPLARLMHAPADIADPAGLPVLAIIAVLWLGLATPAFAAYVRAINVRADQESLDFAREPAGLAASLVRDWDGRAIDPTPLEEAVLYTHPPLKRRLERAAAWARTHER